MNTNPRTLAMLAALGGALPLGLVLSLAILAGALGLPTPSGGDDESDACIGKLAAGTTIDGQTLDAEQVTNAGLIVAAGQHLGIPEPGETIALATALQESGLHNLNYGDRDSLGLFQQRPSQGWGTPSQIMDPTYSATAFYKALTQVNGWAAMPTTDAAQAVQRSAYPDAYAKWTPLAHDLATTLDGTCSSGRGSGPMPPAPAGYQIPPGTPSTITAVIDFALKQLGKPYEYGATGPNTWDCSGLIQAAYAAIGIPLPRTTYDQVNAGTAVPVSDPAAFRPGDLLFIAGDDGTPTSPGHVGLYLGNGLVLHAPKTGDVVRVDHVSGWLSSLSAVRRIA
jgi:cell wall-associated NlpC family hydrolase